MAALKTSSLILNSPFSSSSSKQRGSRIRATIQTPNRAGHISLPGFDETQLRTCTEKNVNPINVETVKRNDGNNGFDSTVMMKLYAIMEAVADRVEMHKNIGDQRNNWNSLLLTSINALTLTAATMAGVAAVTGGAPAAAMKLSSTAMYVAATGMLSIVNKIQPSQLAEEQRNAARLFKQLQDQIETIISIGTVTEIDVKEMMEKVLALDTAYPLPLLGVMLDKFPATVEPAVWWTQKRGKQHKGNYQGSDNGWNGELEAEMRDIVNVIRRKDKEEYLRLGGKALKFNKFLAISGPVLTGLAAVGSAFVGSPSDGGWAVALGVVGGALASVVNAVEHGGQVGMVFEMYRNNAGFFKMMEEEIEWNLREEEMERRENGELFEMKVGLQLGRSISELRDLAAAADNGEDIDEFASKLF